MSYEIFQHSFLEFAGYFRAKTLSSTYYISVVVQPSTRLPRDIHLKILSGIGGGHGVGGDEVVAYEAPKRRLGNAARGYVGERAAARIVEDLLSAGR